MLSGVTSANGFTLSARYLVDAGGQQVTELNGAGTWQHSNVFVGGKLVATYDAKGLHYQIADPLGSRRVQANIQGQMDEYCANLPFGNDLNNPYAANCTQTPNTLQTQNDATEQHFTQKERDSESGNDYFFARYYTSAVGRFTTPDWSAKETPVPYAVFTDPQSMNLYAYVRNNPLIHVDADGHCWGGGWCDIHGNPYQTASEINAAILHLDNLLLSLHAAARQQGVAASCSGCSMSGAAGAAEKAALGMTTANQHKNHGTPAGWQEFGGWILQAVDGGGYSYTNPVATSGGDGHFNPLAVSVPDGYSIAGWYHTHPHFDKDNVQGEGFSEPPFGDVGFISRHPELGTAYVADTISRNMYRITPRPGGDIRSGVDSQGRTTWGKFVMRIPGDPYQ